MKVATLFLLSLGMLQVLYTTSLLPVQTRAKKRSREGVVAKDVNSKNILSLTLPRAGINAEFIQNLKELFRNGGALDSRDVKKIISQSTDLFKSLPNILEIEYPGSIKIIGDTHGQLMDVLHILDLVGTPSARNQLLFNGDMVDRGDSSVEVVLVLFSLSVLYPEYVHLHRGNHESRAMNEAYSFKTEVLEKYDESVYRLFETAFDWLPVGSVLRRSVFVTHGGLFTDHNMLVLEVNKFSRNMEIPDAGPFAELLWSDPDESIQGVAPSSRGCGVLFGQKETDSFLERNGLKLIIRSHELKEEGYEVAMNGKVVTVFSAPNYCGRYDNKGAYVTLGQDSTPQFTTFQGQVSRRVKRKVSGYFE